VSARRFRKMGKIQAALVYAYWTLFGYVLGRKVKYFHVSDVKTR